MKKIAGIFSLVLLTAFCVSCKDDEAEVGATIVGTWQGDHMDAKVVYGVITLQEEEDDEFNATLQFNDDGSVSFTRDGNTTNGTYQLNGTRLTTNVDLQVEGVDFSSVTFDVVELSQTKLRLHLEKDQEVQVPDVGMVNTTIKANLAFDRL
jgi:hypothetical protein